MHPKVSVIIAAYNSEKYIEKCLDSIFNQTFKDFEVIVVNDGSTDQTKNICVRYAAEHNNMVLINQENGGLSNARNSGLNVCQGEYVAFSDSDDYVEINWLQTFMDAIGKEGTYDMIVQGLIINYNNYEEKVSFPEKTYKGRDIINAYTTLKSRSIDGFMHNKIYKKNIINKNNLRFELKLKEDLLFNFKYLYYVSSLVIIPSCCYHYVQHDFQSLIHKRYPAAFMRTLITTVRDTAMALADKYDDDKFRRYIIEDYMLAYSVLLFSMYNKNIGVNNKIERLRYIKEYQQIRKTNHNIKIHMGSNVKRLFAKFMMLPPMLTDYILSKKIQFKMSIQNYFANNY